MMIGQQENGTKKESILEKTAATAPACANHHSSFELRRAMYFSASGVPALTRDESRKPVNLVDEFDPETKHNMIVHNLRLVWNIAKDYTGLGLDVVVLVRVGNQALMQAMEQRAPEQFSSRTDYLSQQIRQKIEHELKLLGQVPAGR